MVFGFSRKRTLGATGLGLGLAVHVIIDLLDCKSRFS